MKAHGLIEIIVYVEDMNAQVAFYREHFGLEVTYPTGLADYGKESWVTLDTGPCVLVLHANGKKRFGPDAPKLVFGVPDIHAAHDDLLQRGVENSYNRYGSFLHEFPFTADTTGGPTLGFRRSQASIASEASRLQPVLGGQKELTGTWFTQAVLPHWGEYHTSPE